MNEQLRAQKHAFMFFTKAPTPGLRQTRLTSARGGFLTPEEATDLYSAVMLDVAEIGHAALQQLNAGAGEKGDTYDFIVCSTPASDMDRVRRIFEETFPGPSGTSPTTERISTSTSTTALNNYGSWAIIRPFP